MRRFLSKRVHWIGGTAVVLIVLFLLLLQRPNHGVKFPDGSILWVLYSQYSDKVPVAYGRFGYALSKIFPLKALLVIDTLCHDVLRLPGMFAAYGTPMERLWAVELVLSGIDPSRSHPLLPSGIFPTNLITVAIGADGKRYTNSVMLYPDPTGRNVSRVFTTVLRTYPWDDVVTLEIWNGGTNAVCRLPVKNPVKALVLKDN